MHAYRPYVGGCGVDHEVVWPAVQAFFGRGRLIGYAYYPTNAGAGTTPLATTRGLALDDRLSTGRLLYGRAFRFWFTQGGSWTVTTPGGQIEGLANGPAVAGRDVGWSSRVITIEAGVVGCAGVTP